MRRNRADSCELNSSDPSRPFHPCELLVILSSTRANFGCLIVRFTFSICSLIIAAVSLARRELAGRSGTRNWLQVASEGTAALIPTRFQCELGSIPPNPTEKLGLSHVDPTEKLGLRWDSGV